MTSVFVDEAGWAESMEAGTRLNEQHRDDTGPGGVSARLYLASTQRLYNAIRDEVNAGTPPADLLEGFMAQLANTLATLVSFLEFQDENWKQAAATTIGQILSGAGTDAMEFYVRSQTEQIAGVTDIKMHQVEGGTQ